MFKMYEISKLQRLVLLNFRHFHPGILKRFRPTSKGDKRILKITVRHLLQHSAGWDRDRVGDAVFWNLDNVSPWVEATSEAANERLVKFIMTKKLQFSPGEHKSSFCYFFKNI